MATLWKTIAWTARHGRQPVDTILGMTVSDFYAFRFGLAAVAEDERAAVAAAIKEAEQHGR